MPEARAATTRDTSRTTKSPWSWCRSATELKDTFAPRTDRSSLSPGNSTPTRVPTFGTRSGGYEGPPRTRVTRWTNRPRDRSRMMVATAPSIRSKKNNTTSSWSS
uniref:(northern house mosquito) hypothetical protein n=1 Tax=Culex pipiens TaxID=7175 RepID=A0A8D8I2S0_CULPI